MKKKDRKDVLFEVERTAEKEWKGMPEFIQEDINPYQTVNVHFACKEDVDDFAKIIGQPITHKTKFIWHPRVDREKLIHLFYLNKENIKNIKSKKRMKRTK